ncbi:SGF29 tudor-like domain-containing protein [Lophiotrema nucula]|uniref:SGF29 tudor-like domain-containing protein n=1 Tax=Lophiotrema nucula TaxID=690887 RepID=A0A6A5ZTX7_9PLEO|nr:SGF29 tudor-like domain-containing protein [Lophiotrema nucula]
MAARSRPRAQLKEEVDEERSIWSQIRADAKRVDQLMEQSNKASKKIVDLSDEQAARLGRGESPSASIDADLEKSLRENIRIVEDIQNLIESESGSNDILKQLEILAALRDAHEPDPITTSRATSVNKGNRERQKRKHTDSLDDRESIAADSPGGGGGPSPKVMTSTKERFMQKSGGSRAGSVPVQRESSVKAEDAGETLDHQKSRLHSGTEVLYRHSNPKSRSLQTEGEGILCRVTTVIGEGKQRRYEIIDADPDPPQPNVPYRASVKDLIPIPEPSDSGGEKGEKGEKGGKGVLGDLKGGTRVLALYPGTTTFYKAEVVAGWRAGATVVKEEGKDDIVGASGGNLVRLRFEGEDEADREMSVERRYVLPER